MNFSPLTQPPRHPSATVCRCRTTPASLVLRNGRAGVFCTWVVAGVLFLVSANCVPRLNGAPVSAVGNPYLFQGARYDGETGLYYARGRYYEPRIGRFLQRDPVWDVVNRGNAYTFAGNNPASLVDPSGEFVPVLLAAAVLGGAIAYSAYDSAPNAEQIAARKKLEALEERREAARAAALRKARCEAQGADDFAEAQQRIEAWQRMAEEHRNPRMWGEGSSGFVLAQQAAYYEDRRRRWQQAHDIYVATYAALGGVASPVPRRIPQGRQFTSTRRVTSNVERARQMGITRRVESTQQALEILGPKDANRGYGRFAKPLPGYGDVFVHGSAQGLSIRTASGRFEPLDFTAFQILVEEAGMAGRKLRLISCESGANMTGIGQRLADYMGVEVLAPVEKVGVEPASGKITVWGGPRAGMEPTWVSFKPRRN